MHAMLVKVKIDPARHAELLSYVHGNLVPRLKGAPGLVKGTWFGNENVGYALLTFQSEEQARQMATTVGSNPNNPAQLEDVQVYEVQAEI